MGSTRSRYFLRTLNAPGQMKQSKSVRSSAPYFRVQRKMALGACDEIPTRISQRKFSPPHRTLLLQLNLLYGNESGPGLSHRFSRSPCHAYQRPALHIDARGKAALSRVQHLTRLRCDSQLNINPGEYLT